MKRLICLDWLFTFAVISGKGEGKSKRKERDDKDEKDGSSAGESVSAPSASAVSAVSGSTPKRSRTTRTAARTDDDDLHSGQAFGAFAEGQLVSVYHRDAGHPNTPIWRAHISKANESTGTYDVFLLEITKSVPAVDPDFIFRPSVNLPAV